MAVDWRIEVSSKNSVNHCEKVHNFVEKNETLHTVKTPIIQLSRDPISQTNG